MNSPSLAFCASAFALCSCAAGCCCWLTSTLFLLTLCLSFFISRLRYKSFHESLPIRAAKRGGGGDDEDGGCGLFPAECVARDERDESALLTQATGCCCFAEGVACDSSTRPIASYRTPVTA